MKCRRIKIDENGNKNIVWFGSYGRKEVETISSAYFILPDSEEKVEFSPSIYVNNALDAKLTLNNVNYFFRFFVNQMKLYCNRNEVQLYEENNQYRFDITLDTEYEGIILNLEKNVEYKAKFYNENNKHDNYSSEQQGVIDSLLQRLSVLKYELWYNYEYGIPLLDKVRNKGTIDSSVINVISEHPDVLTLVNYESEILEDGTYSAYFIVSTIYGNIEFGL